MNSTRKTPSFSSEPSGFSFQNDDLITPQFSDIKQIYASETHSIFIGIRYGRLWVLKGIASPYRENEACREMLKKEFDIMMRLRHDNIVQGVSLENIPSWGECIVMEYIDGITLSQWLQNEPKLRNRFHSALELMDALSYIHKNGIVHRDIKLENILITRLGDKVKIIDFGLSDSDDYAVFKHPAGTKGYVSPEQETSNTPDIRNDIYSLGKILDKLLPERRFTKTRNLCTGPIDKRPSDLNILKEQLTRAYRRPRYGWLFILVLVMLLACIFCAGVYSEWFSSPTVPENHVQESTEIPPSDTVEVINESSREIITIQSQSKKDITSLGKIEDTLPLSQEKTNNSVPPKNSEHQNNQIDVIISQGIARIDKLWNSSAMLYLDTITDSSDIYSDWSTANMERIRDEILVKHKDDVSSEGLKLIE